ncbi:DUF4149 domain-containing protein [Campylobacter sp. RM9328]|uniref:DUF4149 domain-containing protein n=1 Tax=Campylobacter sp. RM9328 TaxID=1705720 RepID=UPI001473BAD6|nr:DUF4149 domain-containing protein [Campylobacter sp. RM9328]
MKNVYLFLLAGLIGVELALGVFVAPAIFYPQRYMGESPLTHFESGVIMTQIFIKYNYALLFVSAFALLFELFGPKGKTSFYIKISSFALAFINLALALAFVFYFTDFIIAAQAMGEEMTMGNAEFDAMHKASEYVMKLMLMAQTLLFFISAIKPKSQA